MILVALRTVIALTFFFKVQTCCTYYKTYQTAIQTLSSEPLQPMLAKHGILIKQEWKLNFCLIGVIPLHDFAAWCAYGELVSCEVIRCQTWHVCTSSFSSFWCRMVGLPAPVYAHLWCMKVCHICSPMMHIHSELFIPQLFSPQVFFCVLLLPLESIFTLWTVLLSGIMFAENKKIIY